MIPIQLYDDPHIEPMDRDVYAVVYWYEHLKDGECRASNDSISCVLNGSSTRAIQNSLTKLEERGYIARDYKDEAQRNRLRIRTLIAFKYIKDVRSVGDRQDDVRSVGDRASAVVVTRVNNKMNKGILAAGAASEFNFETYLKGMEDNKSRHIQVIAFYWKKKRLVYKTLKEAQSAIRRHLRAAMEVANFDDEAIVKAYKVADREYPKMYTVETLHKILTR